MHILDLPNDVIRLIIKEIPDAKGFHSLAISNRLFGRLCLLPVIQEHVKQKYLRIFYVDSSNPDTYILQQQFPNGVKHGLEEHYRKFDHSLHARCYNVNGYREGLGFVFENHKIIQQVTYKKDHRDGIGYEWDFTGTLIGRGIFDQNVRTFYEKWPQPGVYSVMHLKEPSWLSLGMRYRSVASYTFGTLICRCYRNRWIGEFLFEDYNQNVLVTRYRYTDLRWKARPYLIATTVSLLIFDIYLYWGVI